MKNPIITNQISVSDNQIFQEKEVAFHTMKEAYWVRRNMPQLLNNNVPVMETYLGKFVIRMKYKVYNKFLNNLTQWEEEGYVAVP